MIDIQRILALAEMMIQHMKHFEETRGTKFRLNNADKDILAHLFLQGFDIEVTTKIQDWEAKLNFKRHDFRENSQTLDFEFMSMLNGAHKLIAEANKIYFVGIGVHERLKNTILKIDEFLHKYEILGNKLREKLKNGSYEDNRRDRERRSNNRAFNDSRTSRH